MQSFMFKGGKLFHRMTSVEIGIFPLLNYFFIYHKIVPFYIYSKHFSFYLFLKNFLN